MKFSVLSEEGDILGLATHLSSEGHSVEMAVDTVTSLGEGVVTIKPIEDLFPGDITVFDNNKWGQLADRLREEGRRVLGASHFSEMIHKDKEYASQVIASLGWDQSEVKRGVNLYITVWFNGSHYIAAYSSLVYRRFMSGGRGPDVKGTGVVSLFHDSLTESVRNNILKPLEKVLRRVNHRGCFHVHTVITGDKFSVPEISGLFYSPLTLTLLENSRPSVSDVLLRLFDETSKPISLLDSWATALLVTIPPYPYQLPTEETVIKGIESPALKHLWFMDVKKKGSDWITAATHGKIGYITARGNTLHEAVKRAYRTVNRFEVRDIQYRDDVGRNLNNLLKHLRDYKWIR